jgi:hypothetical protein
VFSTVNCFLNIYRYSDIDYSSYSTRFDALPGLRPHRFLIQLVIDNRVIRVLIAGRRPCTSVHVLFGFFGAPVSRTGSHPRCPDIAGFAASRVFFASPEKRASGSVFHPATSAPPCTASRAGGLSPEKPSPDRGEIRATIIGPCREANTRPSKGSGCFSAVAEGFSGLWPRSTHQRARGVEAAGQWTQPKAWRLALAVNRNPAQPSRAKAQPVFVFARCERGPDGAAPEKPGVARAQSCTGVDPRYR